MEEKIKIPIGKMPVVLVRVTPQLHEKLREIAERENRSLGRQARVLLESVLETAA